MLHLYQILKWLSSLRDKTAPRCLRFAFKWKYLECKRKKRIFLWDSWFYFAQSIIIKKSHLREKIWFSDIRFNDSENQTLTDIYFLVSLLGFLLFATTVMKTIVFLFFHLLQLCIFYLRLIFLSPILSIWSKDSTVHTEIIPSSH